MKKRRIFVREILLKNYDILDKVLLNHMREIYLYGDIVIQVKKRNMAMQILLWFVTFGIYGIYWFYETGVELKYIAKDEEAAPGLWTVLCFIPFGIFYSYYKYSELFEKVSSEKLNKWIIFLLFIVFCPAVWFIVQRDLNMIAQKENLLQS